MKQRKPYKSDDSSGATTAVVITNTLKVQVLHSELVASTKPDDLPTFPREIWQNYSDCRMQHFAGGR